MHTQTLIQKFSHFFVVRYPTPLIIPVIYTLSSRYTQFGMTQVKGSRRQKWGPTKTFALYVQNGIEFRFHIGQFTEFMQLLDNSGVNPSSYSVEEIPDYMPERITLKVRDHWKLRPEQEEAKDFAFEVNGRDHNNVMFVMGTGTGKTSTSLIGVSELKCRIVILVLANFIDQWKNALTDIFEIDKKEIAVIQGSDSLIRSTNYPGSGWPIPKAFIISLTTINNWYKIYE